MPKGKLTPLPEIFGRRIELPNGGHADVGLDEFAEVREPGEEPAPWLRAPGGSEEEETDDTEDEETASGTAGSESNPDS